MHSAAVQEQLRQKDLHIEALSDRLVETQRMLQACQHQIEQLTRRLYGPKSEKFDPGQLLFDGLLISGLEQPVSPPPAPPAETEVKSHTRKPKGHGREELPDHLRRVEIAVDVPDEEKVCPETGEQLVRIGEERTEKLAYEAEDIYVKVFVRPKYGSPVKKNGSSVSGIVIADLPFFPIAKCKADTSLLAYVAVSKYVDHQPLYRQEQIFRREGISISRKTMTGWLMQLADGPLLPLYNALAADILARDIMFTDDTPVRLQIKGRGKTRQARMWAYRAGTDPPAVVFDFSRDRSKQRPLQFLDGYLGYVHADAYSGYDELFTRDGIIEVGCWVHARRKFDEATASSPREATEMLAMIRRLYEIEDLFRDADDQRRVKGRKEQAAPVLGQIFERAEQMSMEALPKSPLGQALTYLLNQKDALQCYLQDGRLRPDNNLAENVIRPLALGRKNWLFCGSDRGGRAAAVYFSIFQTCLLNDINPRTYLQDVLDRIMTYPPDRIADLLPHNWKPVSS